MNMDEHLEEIEEGFGSELSKAASTSSNPENKASFFSFIHFLFFFFLHLAHFRLINLERYSILRYPRVCHG